MTTLSDLPEIDLPVDFRGEILRPGDASFVEASKLFNTRGIRCPTVIARCLGVADVQAALSMARTSGLEVSVRSGGHHVAGWASNDNGIVIDLTAMRWVRVDPETSTAWVGGGTRAIDALSETSRFGFAPVTGTSPGIGLSGLLTGLGEGYLTARYGFGIDNVLAYDIVTADGTAIQVSSENEPELFWAMRGAGPNFGVVTAIKLQLHPLPPQAVGGWVTFGADDAETVTRHLWEVWEGGSENFWPLAMYKGLQGGGFEITVIPGHTGAAPEAERDVNALRNCGAPTDDTARVMSYRELVGEIDLESGRTAWDLCRFSFDGPRLEQIDLLLDNASRLVPTSYYSLWRTPSRPTGSASSAAPIFPGVTMSMENYWTEASADDDQVRWLSETAAAFHSSDLVGEGSNAMNELSSFDHERVRHFYGEETHRRLAALKAKYDPNNILHRNFNILPLGFKGSDS